MVFHSHGVIGDPFMIFFKHNLIQFTFIRIALTMYFASKQRKWMFMSENKVVGLKYSV